MNMSDEGFVITGVGCGSGDNRRMPRARRLRGLLIRLVLNRPAAIAAGLALAAPAALVMARDYSWETGVTDGIALLILATGVALAWAGAIGRRADWVE
jgi:hypothetical protein